MDIKIRPAILIVSLGMIVALNLIIYAIILAIRGSISVEMLTAVIAFGGTITTGLVAITTKLVESEENDK